MLNSVPLVQHERPLILDDVYELSIGHDAVSRGLRWIPLISVVGLNDDPLSGSDPSYIAQIVQDSGPR